MINPKPPTWIISNMMIWPKRVNSSPIPFAYVDRPVTHVALVAWKIASIKLPHWPFLWAKGKHNKNAPKTMTPTKDRITRRYGDVCFALRCSLFRFLLIFSTCIILLRKNKANMHANGQQKREILRSLFFAS